MLKWVAAFLFLSFYIPIYYLNKKLWKLLKLLIFFLDHLDNFTKDSLKIIEGKAKIENYTKIEDETIADAWEGIQSVPPWTVKRFINQLSEYDDDSIFDLFNTRK